MVAAFRMLAPTPEEKLAAYEAAHMVPDEDNAAITYTELFRGEEIPLPAAAINLAHLTSAVQDPVSSRESQALLRELRELEPSEQGLGPNVVRVATSRPWRSSEYPELRRWLETHRHRIDRMLEGSRQPSCRFRLQSAGDHMGLLDVPLGVLKQNVFLLCLAAGNDLGEGDVEAAVAKWRALMAMGRHFREQPNESHFLTGIALEAMAIDRFMRFIVEGPASDQHVQDLVILCEKPAREWESIRRDINRVRDILGDLWEDRRVLKYRIYMRYRRICYGDRGWLEDRPRELYQRLQSDQRGLRIVIELRRFKNRTGGWPESLDPIVPSLPSGILIDPINGGAYVYRCSEDGFCLYSRGPNRIDENGAHKQDGPDDWSIWPR